MFKNERHRVKIFGFLLIFLRLADSQNAPHVPCPDTFQYMSYGNNYIGMVTLNKLPLSTTVVEVEFVQREPITTEYNGKLSLSQSLPETQKRLESGQPISYRVDFPVSNIFPKLIGIKVNGNTICSGQGMDAPSTTFKLQHTFYPAVPTTFNRPSVVKVERPNNSNEVRYTYTLEPQSNTQFNTIPSSLNPFLQQYFGQQTPNIFEIPLTQNRNTPIPRPPSNPPVRPVVNNPPQTIPNVGCGREGLTPFVVGGHDYPRGKFPWLVAIYLRDSADLKFTCGGSLISANTVITAAHCFPTSTFSPDRISVYLGRHNLFVAETGAQQRDISRLSVHPNYNASAISDADIALLHLSVPVDFTQYIRPICLWSQSTELSFIEGQSGFIAGWGADNEGHAVTNVAKMVEARIVSESECLRSSDLFRTLTSSRSLCAGNRDGTGPCVGDSGGGLMLNVFGVWTLRGILSVGKTIQRNCDLKEFVVYCDVAKHMTWIRQNM